jgi:cytochrome c5
MFRAPAADTQQQAEHDAPEHRRHAHGDRAGEAIVQATCAACHQAGAAGAPKLADSAAWAPRIKTGLNAMVQSVIKGKGAMPPKAGDASLTDAEITRAVVHMENQAVGKFKQPSFDL